MFFSDITYLYELRDAKRMQKCELHITNSLMIVPVVGNVVEWLFGVVFT